MRISDWSSDVCSSDLDPEPFRELAALVEIEAALAGLHQLERRALHQDQLGIGVLLERPGELVWIVAVEEQEIGAKADRSEEHTSELQSLLRISYAVICLKQKTKS